MASPKVPTVYARSPAAQLTGEVGLLARPETERSDRNGTSAAGPDGSAGGYQRSTNSLSRRGRGAGRTRSPAVLLPALASTPARTAAFHDRPLDPTPSPASQASSWRSARFPVRRLPAEEFGPGPPARRTRPRRPRVARRTDSGVRAPSRVRARSGAGRSRACRALVTSQPRFMVRPPRPTDSASRPTADQDPAPAWNPIRSSASQRSPTSAKVTPMPRSCHSRKQPRTTSRCSSPPAHGTRRSSPVPGTGMTEASVRASRSSSAARCR